MGQKVQTLEELESKLAAFRHAREDWESTFWVVSRFKDEYNWEVARSERRLQVRNDELYRLCPDAGLEGKSRNERSEELEQRRKLLREQQLSLKDRAIATWGKAYNMSSHKRTSRKLERTLSLQSRILKRREFYDPPTAFDKAA